MKKSNTNNVPTWALATFLIIAIGIVAVFDGATMLDTLRSIGTWLVGIVVLVLAALLYLGLSFGAAKSHGINIYSEDGSLNPWVLINQT